MTSFIRNFGSLLLLVIFLAFPVRIFAIDIPTPAGYVNDLASVLSKDQKENLEKSLQSYKDTTGNEIAILVVKDLQGEEINDFAVRTFEKWEIGQKDKDNGVLVLVSIDERQVKIEVGYGLEPYITDSDAGNIIRNNIAPSFRDGNYYEGLNSAVSEIKKELSKSTQSPSFGDTDIEKWANYVPFLIIAAIYLFSFMARSKSVWLGGIAGGIIGIAAGVVLGSILVLVIFLVLFSSFGFLLDWVLSRAYSKSVKSGRHTDWFHTGGGFFSGGGGFGGFGGGSSGGGGASGRW